MWYSGELATAHRKNFTKFQDLAKRVIPSGLREQDIPDTDQIDWLCRGALDRMAFGSEGDIQRFWDAVSSQEAKQWTEQHVGELVPVEIEGADGSLRPALAPGDIEVRLDSAPAPTRRLRILNPFDPVIRDRTRLERLFGFDYRIEMFVPASKRRWGYYVYPLLEGDRFVGRIDLKADRKAGTLIVQNFWPEPGIRWSDTRTNKLHAELDRLARFVSVEDVVRECVV